MPKDKKNLNNHENNNIIPAITPAPIPEPTQNPQNQPNINAGNNQQRINLRERVNQYRQSGRERMRSAWHRARNAGQEMVNRARHRARGSINTGRQRIGNVLNRGRQIGQRTSPVIRRGIIPAVFTAGRNAINVATKFPIKHPYITGALALIIGGVSLIYYLSNKNKNDQPMTASEQRDGTALEDRRMNYDNPNLYAESYNPSKPQELPQPPTLAPMPISRDTASRNPQNIINQQRPPHNQVPVRLDHRLNATLNRLHQRATNLLDQVIDIMYVRESKTNNGKVPEEIYKQIVGYYETVNSMLAQLSEKQRSARSTPELLAISKEYQRIITRLEDLLKNYSPANREQHLLSDQIRFGVRDTFFEWAKSNQKLNRTPLRRERMQHQLQTN
ncbi:MAG: hypothetical protein N3E37_01370 [Candidatus Micrarchaeota archaeon]|nr:hypothetical protein [Candidatus Micrarchaeota archaeon]